MFMATTNKIYIQDGDTVIELTGADKDAFIAEREAINQAIETAETARQTKLDSAITKLKALGLTESEAKIIIGLE
jgi:hypothetical protein